jgi:hypothetical protein
MYRSDLTQKSPNNNILYRSNNNILYHKHQSTAVVLQYAIWDLFAQLQFNNCISKENVSQFCGRKQNLNDISLSEWSGGQTQSRETQAT